MATNITPLVWAEAEGIRYQLGYSHILMSFKPALWFGFCPVSSRDDKLIHRPPVDFLDQTRKERFSHLRSLVYTMRDGDNTTSILDWTSISNRTGEAAVLQTGATITPEQPDPIEPTQCVGEKLQVQVNFHPGSGIPVDTCLFSCLPTNTRVFRGPEATCSTDPWDAMILYDCVACPGTPQNVGRFVTRKWDILLLKVCHDEFDHPWLVLNMSDAGAVEQPEQPEQPEQSGPQHEVPTY